MVFAREYSVLSTLFNTCPPYFKAESKITRDFAAQCSMFTYNCVINIVETNKTKYTKRDLVQITLPPQKKVKQETQRTHFFRPLVADCLEDLLVQGILHQMITDVLYDSYWTEK